MSPKRRKMKKSTLGSIKVTREQHRPVEESSDSSEVISSADEEERWKETSLSSGMPADYWNIQKLVKYIKAGDETVTRFALTCLKDYDLTNQINQLAIRDIGGIEVLVNLLECKAIQSKISCLTVLSKISLNIDIRKTLVDLGCIPILINILTYPTRLLKIFASDTIANVSKTNLARKLVRKHGGIQKLVDLLDVELQYLKKPMAKLNVQEQELIEMAKAGARALWKLSESRHNRELMIQCGFIPLVGRILKGIHVDLLIPVMGTIKICASDSNIQLAMTTEKIITDIVKHLNSKNIDLKLQSTLAILKYASNETVQEIVRIDGGLVILVETIKDQKVKENLPLLAASTGAIWHCAVNEMNAKELFNLGAIPILVDLLLHENDDVLTNVVGAIAECVKYSNWREQMKKLDGIPRLVNLLVGIHTPLLINLSKALKECALDQECLTTLADLDAIRLIWSLLKNENAEVQAYAAWALCPCIENTPESGELVRSLIGAFEVVVSRLKSNNTLVQSAICAVIATIAKDKTNLEILLDFHVLSSLTDLLITTDDQLRENLATAIASCIGNGDEIKAFHRLENVQKIVGFMVSNNLNVQRATVMALEKLSRDPKICMALHQSGVIPFLLNGFNSNDKQLQEAASQCLYNIKKMAFKAEKQIFKIN